MPLLGRALPVDAARVPLLILSAQRVLLWVLACLALGACSEPGPRPTTNLVLIVIDDLGWRDLGVYGNPFYETPAIDALAADGARFTNFYAVAPVCSPTRASILTGRHPARLGMTEFIPGQWRPFERLAVPETANQLPRDVPTLGELLGEAGYETGYFGKWHVGGQPSDRGFETSLMAGGQHVAPRIKTRPTTPLRDGTYLADYLTDRAIGFIQEHQDDPFFLVLGHMAVHTPLQAKAEAIAHFEAKPQPPGIAWNPRYAAMLRHVDESVGRLRAELERLGLSDRTVVVFTSDNGAARFHPQGLGDPISSNAPLRGQKGSLYEGGLRVPLIVNWPGRTSAGSEVAELGISMDLFPTLLEAAGLEVGEADVDGRSLVPLLDDPAATLGRDTVHFHYPHYHYSRPAGAIRDGPLKLIEYFDDGSVELYDLAADPGETRDVSSQRPEDAERLGRRLEAWRRSVDAPMPRPNPEYDPERATEWWHLRRGERVNLEDAARSLEPWKYTWGENGTGER